MTPAEDNLHPLPGLPASRRSLVREKQLAALRQDPRRFLRVPNDPFYVALSELQDIFMWSTVEFWRAQGARYQFLPITTTSISSPTGLGSDSLPVKVTLAGQETYLADSLQFLLEYSCRIWKRGAFYVMPSFRGEAVDATHLNEFMHVEAELSLTLPALIALVNRYILHVCARILENFQAAPGAAIDLSHLRRLQDAGPGAFRIMTFDEVTEALGDATEYVQTIVPGARTLTRAGERAVHQLFGDFVWVSEWDHLAVPFYQRMLPGTSKAECADLFFGVGEVVGAGERHTNGAEVLAALAHHKVPAQDYQWYIAMKDQLPMQTSGFGLGVDRFLMWVASHSDIRDMQLLLRENGVRHAP